MNNKFLETRNVTKTFGKLKALDDVNFNLYQGKIHGLLGENGAGKSSLMNILSGIYQPDKGSIYLDGEKQKILNPDFASKLGIGMVHQEFRLVESFSIKDNLTLSKSNIYKNDFLKSFKKYSEIFALNVNENEIMKKSLKILNAKKLGFIVVNNKHGLNSGIFTDGDLKRIAHKYNKFDNLELKKVMKKNPISIEKDSLAVSALSIMNSRKITSLCVHRKKKIKKTIIFHLLFYFSIHSVLLKLP